MMKTIRLHIMIMIAFMSFSFMSCNVHEWPGEEPKANIKLNLDYNTSIDEYLTMYTDLGRTSRSPEDYDVRYIIQAYLYISEKTYIDRPIAEFRFTRDDANQLDCSHIIDLAPGRYKIMVWTDFVSQDTDTDKFYAPDDFYNISITGEYDGNNDFRDAFVGTLDVDIDYADLSSTAGTEYTVLMGRPLAKYYFVTTDVKEFTDRYLEQLAAKGQAKAGVDTKNIDFSKFKLRFDYTGYLPWVFNMHTNRPIKIQQNMFFDSKVTNVTENEATLGFDYVFVNGAESAVAVSVSLYDADGTLISMSGTINVPLIRSKYTIVKGKFFTQSQSGGVGIDPSFNGDWNVWVP